MIDVSRRNAAAATYVDSLDEIAVSIITAHELIVGARNQRDAEGIDGLINTYRVEANLDARITGRAYQLLKRHAKPDGLRTFDALIGCDRHRGRVHARIEEPQALPDDWRSESGSARLLRPSISQQRALRAPLRLAASGQGHKPGGHARRGLAGHGTLVAYGTL